MCSYLKFIKSRNDYDVISFIPTMDKHDKDVQEEELGDLDKAF